MGAYKFDRARLEAFVALHYPKLGKTLVHHTPTASNMILQNLMGDEDMVFDNPTNLSTIKVGTLASHYWIGFDTVLEEWFTDVGMGYEYDDSPIIVFDKLVEFLEDCVDEGVRRVGVHIGPGDW